MVVNNNTYTCTDTCTTAVSPIVVNNVDDDDGLDFMLN